MCPVCLYLSLGTDQGDQSLLSLYMFVFFDVLICCVFYLLPLKPVGDYLELPVKGYQPENVCCLPPWGPALHVWDVLSSRTFNTFIFLSFFVQFLRCLVSFFLTCTKQQSFPTSLNFGYRIWFWLKLICATESGSALVLAVTWCCKAESQVIISTPPRLTGN